MYAHPVATSLRTAPSLARLLDSLVDESWNLPVANASPRCDVYTDRQAYYVEVELPGIAKHNVKVKVEGNILQVRAERTETETKFYFLRRERPVGKIEQTFRLGDSLDAERLEARFEEGLLRIKVPLKALCCGPRNHRDVRPRRGLRTVLVDQRCPLAPLSASTWPILRTTGRIGQKHRTRALPTLRQALIR